MRKATVIIVLFLITWAFADFIKPVICHPAEVRDIVPIDMNGATHLNITVWHNVESSIHFVDIIEVNWGSNVTSLTFAPKPLTPDGTFIVDYNMGLVPETATITVRARCTITSYSGATSWTGTIPEASPTSSPSPSPAPTPTPTPTPSPTNPPTPTPTILPSPSPSPTETPSPSPEPTIDPTQSPEPQPEPFPTTLVAAIVSIAAIIGIGLFVYFKKRKYSD